MHHDGGLAPQGPPLPTRQMMSQWWRDLVFVHWRVPVEDVAPLLPPGVRPDVHDGCTWVGLIPFRLCDGGLGRRGPVPWLGTFLETNVRLYSVDDAGRRGVVFRSLDAERLPVVAGARAAFALPYQWARMSGSPSPAGDPTGVRLRYETRRRTGTHPRSALEVEVGEPVTEPSELDHFLTARFGLHTRVAGRTLWVPNTHGPWPLRRAALRSLDDELVAAAGFPGVAGSRPESVLFSSGVHTVFGLPQRVDGQRVG